MSRSIRRHYKAAGAVRDVDLALRDGRLAARIDGEDRPFGARLLRMVERGAVLAVERDGATVRAVVVRDRDTLHVALGGRTWRFQAVQPRPGGETHAADDGDPFAASPMTGVVRKVLVKPGDAVASGATLFVVEAMKMEFAVTAPRDVVVGEVRSAEGARVDIQQVVVTFAGGHEVSA